jgi:hypothetical protein
MNTAIVTVTHFLDDGGTPIVSVPLTNTNKNAILCQSDFNELIRLGVDPRWKLATGQVFQRGENHVSVARLIANAKKGEKVQYRDGDTLNLKLNNLITSHGAGRFTERDKLNREYVTLKDKVELNHIHQLPSWEIAENARIRG